MAWPARKPRRNLRPRIAAPNKWARIEALLRNRAFVDYMAARQPWREGAQVIFPAGTYWLRRFAYVPVPVVETRTQLVYALARHRR